MSAPKNGAAETMASNCRFRTHISAHEIELITELQHQSTVQRLRTSITNNNYEEDNKNSNIHDNALAAVTTTKSFQEFTRLICVSAHRHTP